MDRSRTGPSEIWTPPNSWRLRLRQGVAFSRASRTFRCRFLSVPLETVNENPVPSGGSTELIPSKLGSPIRGGAIGPNEVSSRPLRSDQSMEG